MREITKKERFNDKVLSRFNLYNSIFSTLPYESIANTGVMLPLFEAECVKGYEKNLELTGVGYRAALKGNVLNLQLGFSHDINFNIPDGVKIQVEKQNFLKITGTDKQQVGMVAAEIKSLRPPEPYKGKGIKEQGQYILRKEGKKK